MAEESYKGLSEKTKENFKQLREADEELEKMKGGVPAKILAIHACNKICVAHQIAKDTGEELPVLQERFPLLEMELEEVRN